MSSTSAVEHLNPEGLHANPAFTNVVVAHRPERTIYVGGQNALTVDGDIVGAGDLAAQAEQVFDNLEVALAAAGAELRHVVKWNVYVVDGQPLEAGFEVFRRRWGRRGQPPTITVAVVSALANPDFLLEIEAVAVV